MICWKCLVKADVIVDETVGEEYGSCPLCGIQVFGQDNIQARADRFMALVGRVTTGILACPDKSLPTTPESIEARANMIMGRIERSVLDGALWEGEKP